MSFPEGLTSPTRTSATPYPPSIPPCHTYMQASGAIVSRNDISIRPPTFKRTTIFWKFSLTSLSISVSISVSINAPFSSVLSLSSPAVLAIITMAESDSPAASCTSSSVTGISACDHGSCPQPSPRSTGCSLSHAA